MCPIFGSLKFGIFSKGSDSKIRHCLEKFSEGKPLADDTRIAVLRII
jgi:hypothetical protein